jgi:hypothetical protein
METLLDLMSSISMLPDSEFLQTNKYCQQYLDTVELSEFKLQHKIRLLIIHQVRSSYTLADTTLIKDQEKETLEFEKELLKTI